MTQDEYNELEARAKPGAFSTYDMEITVPEVQKLKPGQVYLEVGVDRGKSLSIARMVSDPQVKVYGVDLREDPKVPGTIFLRQDSTKAKISKPVDVLFIDGDHSYEGCKADIENWYLQMAERGVMMFHDCDVSSPGVVKAFEEFVEEHNFADVFVDPHLKCSMARIRL